MDHPLPRVLWAVLMCIAMISWAVEGFFAKTHTWSAELAGCVLLAGIVMVVPYGRTEAQVINVLFFASHGGLTIWTGRYNRRSNCKMNRSS